MTDIPHFSVPLRFVNGAAVVLEQDTTDEIMTCGLAILLCPLGSRVELPTFGIPDPSFTQGLPSTDVIEAGPGRVGTALATNRLQRARRARRADRAHSRAHWHSI
jgi:hypothetical protein